MLGLHARHPVVGLFVLDSGDSAFQAATLAGTGAIVDLAQTADGRLIVARLDGVEVLTAQGTAGTVWPILGPAVSSVAAHAGEVLVGTDEGLHRIDGNGTALLPTTSSLVVRDLVVLGEVACMATASGLQRYDLAATQMLAPLMAPDELVDDDVRALALASDGTSILAASAGGTRWIGTAAGVARIGFAPQTLVDKAAEMEVSTERHWRMDGFVADDAGFADEWDQAGEPDKWDKDNDGLWTEMQIAAWCFAYATTGEEMFLSSATKSEGRSARFDQVL